MPNYFLAQPKYRESFAGTMEVQLGRRLYEVVETMECNAAATQDKVRHQH